MLTPGDRLGPYELVAPLGAGGMGEVWRARDERLGREVAVKLLPASVAADAERRRWFEGEARATAALAHPNVVAIFDVGVDGGRPYLVEELLEGETLARRIRAGDLTVGRSVALAVQVAHGLAAAHERGIVHRDLKPDNLFLTRDGVVKILDFGLAVPSAALEAAGGEATEPSPEGTAVRAVGTPAYMAPEQARGRAVDHRADLFALGAVLYEMLAGARPFVGDSHADLVASILTRDPPPLPPSVPRGVQAVVLRCLEKRPEDRFTSARDVAYALEAALESTPARVMEQRREEPRPYPGLAAFTEADGERFFGREEEVAVLWRKLPERKLLALIGPSGAGKTSFVRAGLVAHAPPRWRCLVATPGQSPFAGLARALAPHFAGEPEAIAELIDLHRPEVGPALVARWAEGCDGALVVIDQAEELFTQSGEEVQARFAELLGRLAELDRVHVLLSLRDDFLMRCGAFAPLRRVFEGLTPLLPPAGDALRRAVVEPARRLGFAVEDEALVDEMLQAVEGERGALPLLAFSVSRLWEERDRERKLLTREAFNRIAGVAGALAQHAEATLELLGENSVQLVRELFRNLTTAQQTRCVLEWDELLSVFPTEKRGDAERVLSALVDARLLTSFELEGADGAWQHRVEVVHESLLRSWPRLQRWQAQDEEGALLRDQLRQAARLWHERGRPEDLLWTGNAVTEYRLWRTRYPGGLSAAEEDFGRAMVALSGRRRRRRTVAVMTALVAAVAVAAVTTALWRRGEAAARRLAERQLSEMARQAMANSPPRALAYATACLQLDDSVEGRRLALQAIQSSPMPLVIAGSQLPSLAAGADFSPDGRWLSVGHFNGYLTLWPSAGGTPILWRPHRGTARGYFAPDSRTLSSLALGDSSFAVWSVPDLSRLGDLERAGRLRGDADARYANIAGDLVRAIPDPAAPGGWGLDQRALRRCEQWAGDWLPAAAMSPDGTELVVAEGERLLLHDLDQPEGAPVLLGRCPSSVEALTFHPDGRRLAAFHADGALRLWSLAHGSAELLRQWSQGRDRACNQLRFDPCGALLVAAYDEGSAEVRALDDPPGAEPLLLLPFTDRMAELAFHPQGRWLATAGLLGVSLWPLDRDRFPRLLRGHSGKVESVAFAPDGSWLLSCSSEGTVRQWPLSPGPDREPRLLFDWGHPHEMVLGSAAVSPDGRFVVVTGGEDSARLVPLDGSPVITLGGFDHRVARAAIDLQGRHVAVPGRYRDRLVVRVWDLSSGGIADVDLGEEGASHGDTVISIRFTADGRLMTAVDGRLLRVDPTTGEHEVLAEGVGELATDHEGRVVLSRPAMDGAGGVATVHRISAGTATGLESHGALVRCVALDRSGAIAVTGSHDGIVRVGPAAGGEPQWLVGPPGSVSAVAVSPDGRLVASAGADGVIRLWQMPDLGHRPLHLLPHAAFVARLHSLTNLRAVPDPGSDSGWRIEVDPFPGWAVVPEWQP